MSDYFRQVISPDLSARLAEINSASFDFIQVLLYCSDYVRVMTERFRELDQERQELEIGSSIPSTTGQAICVAAVMTYCRPFKSGCRWRLPDELLSHLTDQERLNHQFFLDLRDKLFAHSVSEIEYFVVTVDFDRSNPDDSSKWSLSCGGGGVSELGLANMENLRRLAKRLKDILHIEEDREREALMSIIKTRGLAAVSTKLELPGLDVSKLAGTKRRRYRTQPDD